MWKKFIIVFVIFAVVLAVALFVCKFHYLSGFYKNNQNYLDFLVQVFLGGAAVVAAIANFKMLKANRSMAKAANTEIDILKHQHDYAITPILEIKFIDGRFSLNSFLIINNITNNIALKVTTFAKLSGKWYISLATEILGPQKYTRILFQDEANFEKKFDYIYDNHLPVNSNFRKNFLDFFNEENNGFFTVYIDIEGKIHGTCLICHYIHQTIRGVQVFPPDPESFETKRRDIPYHAAEQHFFIGDEVIKQGTGIAIAPLPRIPK